MLKLKILILYFIGFISIIAQKITEFQIDNSENQVESVSLVNTYLDEITQLKSKDISLYKIVNGISKKIPFQIYGNEHRFLYWFAEKSINANQEKYILMNEQNVEKYNKVVLIKNDGKLIFNRNGKDLLSYQYETIYPPEEVDSNYKRSAFIHPLWAPRGQILTQIQPKDHYHHYGIWNPWTHVLFESDTVDFWNLAKHEGTVKFGDFISTVEGPVFSEFKALHKHIVFKENKKEKVALNELQTIRVYNTDDPNSYIADIVIELNCASKSPVTLLEYRYGGLGWRATEKWDKNNSEVLTSEYKTRIDADGSLARWFIVQGEIDNDYAGLMLMSYPTNYNHPEPVRIWPIPKDKRGDVFANFSPTKNMDWELLPGKTYILKYRLLVFNGKMTKEQAEKAWKKFSDNIQISINK